VTGIFTLAIALHDYLELTDAVSIGARRLAISRGQTTDPCATTATAVDQASPFLKSASITFTFVLNCNASSPCGGSNGTTYSGASCSSSSTTTGAAGNLVQGSAAQITATYPCTLSVYGSANLLPNCTMTAQMTELVQ
jgi:Flp pilus assembly protein TadG